MPKNLKLLIGEIQHKYDDGQTIQKLSEEYKINPFSLSLFLKGQISWTRKITNSLKTYKPKPINESRPRTFPTKIPDIDSINTEDKLSGTMLGNILIVGKINSPDKRFSMWKGICKCGNTVIVRKHDFRTKGKKSCGCLTESMIASKLKQYFKSHYAALLEYSSLNSPKTGYPLKYDIFIPERKAFIEVHGLQHYEFIQHFYKNYEEFEYRKGLDELKKSYAQKHGTYIEIDLRKIKTPEEAIAFIEERL